MAGNSVPEPLGTAGGTCRGCGHWWRSGARIVNEVDSDSGAGATIVECPGEHQGTPLTVRQQPRTWSD